MKQFIEIVKGIFSDKRKRSGVGVIVCVLFMFLMVMMVRPQAESYKKTLNKSNSNIKKTNNKNAIENYGNMNSYEVTYDINITEKNINKVYKITGTYFEDKYYLMLDNKTYYIVEDKIYLVDDLNNKLLLLTDKNSIFNKFDFNLLLKKNTYNTINYCEEKAKTEYKDGTATIEYLYKNYKNNYITMVVKEGNGLINQIDYDFTNYYDKNIYQLLKVNVTYTNINNISSYNRNYDKYTIIDNNVTTSNIVVNSNSNVISNSNGGNQ
jgi:hypothetical protein